MANRKYALTLSILVVLLAMASTVTTNRAYIPGPGTQVAIVPDPSHTNGGTLPTIDAAFANFTFTNLPWANVTAGNLTNYQIVVLVVDAGAPTPLLSPQQVTDLNNWTYYGGKLIIYDSEMPSVDYSWLPYPFTTNNPGGVGAVGNPITYLEDNTLGDSNPSSYYYINTTQSGANIWGDAVGDCNVFVTFDSNWCGDMEAVNALQTRGWVHTYAVYGSGLMIYNGYDIDYLLASSVPGPVGIANLAKVWLLELAQPWGSDYNLPCSRKAIQITVGGEVITPVGLTSVILAIAMAIVIISVAVVSRKLARAVIPSFVRKPNSV